MTVLELEASTTISIDRMIFHVVGPHLEQPVLLTEVDDIEPYADFFVDRLESSLRGSLYHFSTASTLRDQIDRALTDPSQFVGVSEILARRFQEYYDVDKRLVAGVLMLFLLRRGDERLAAVVKFDHTRVISYETEDLPDGRKRAVLANLMTTFVQERTAMQKSAVITITAEGGTLVCTDRAGQHGDLTDRFREFLDARRDLTHAQMTKRLYEALLATGKECAAELPAEVVGQMAARIRAALRSDGGYDPDNPAAMLASAFGPLDNGARVHATFARNLKSAKILSEPIRFDPAELPRSNRRIKETDEGVQVIYTPEAEQDGYIRFEPAQGGRLRVIIETSGFVKDDILDEKARQRR
ncbi:hypothetical protein GAY29_21905 [Azospirillum brasilense]|uniref:nucleoid-associated protein n=1 Tax=Azospirillum brasilense TaxID=192 RepID=UPI00190C873E|nr:nucleoid-associated protein [Azospirillum brasilense]MBK3735705.1 hypothetical protein [Azospirillum brasilense]